MHTLPRNITSRLLDALQISPIVFLNGPRQAGKSKLVKTLADQISSKHPAKYLSFDQPVQIAAASSEPEAFLSSHRGMLIIDEVQMVPEIFRTLKIVVDDLRQSNKSQANGRFLLTGSANILVLPKLADALVGRLNVMTLYPFSVAETQGIKDAPLDYLINHDFSSRNNKVSLLEAMQIATFPEISELPAEKKSIWFDGYITTLLQRDVKMLAELERISLLPMLLRLLATRAGSLLNDADIARSIGLNAVTGKAYRTILKMMFLTFDVPPWFRNKGKRLVKSPKGYLIDSLLLCHMLDIRIEDLREKRPELYDHLLENFVATELLKQLTFSKTKAQLFHFRTADGKEVDFVLEKADGTVFGIEVKASEIVTAHDFKGLDVLAAIAEKDYIGGIVLYTGKEVVPFGKQKWAVPIHLLY